MIGMSESRGKGNSQNESHKSYLQQAVDMAKPVYNQQLECSNVKKENQFHVQHSSSAPLSNSAIWLPCLRIEGTNLMKRHLQPDVSV